jgi:hypothetical protein
MDINRMSREKLLKAGYKFIRMTDYPTKDGIRHQIRYCDNVNFVWKLLETYPTKVARERAAEKLITDGPYLYY